MYMLCDILRMDAMINEKRKNLPVEGALHRRLKLRAVKVGKSLTEYAAELLEKAMAQEEMAKQR